MRAALATRLGARRQGTQLTWYAMPTNGAVTWHRMAGVTRPLGHENSRSSIVTAIAEGRLFGDLDVLTTLDGVLVLMHDATTGRTCATNVTVATTNYADMPMLYKPSITGSGYVAEPIPKLDDILAEFGGRIFMSLEPKLATNAQVTAIANLIKKHGLEQSVCMNTSSTTVMGYIHAQGIWTHAYGITTTAGVDAARAQGAEILAVAYNCGTTVRDYALASGAHRVMGSTSALRTDFANRTPGLHLYNIDCPLYTDRTTRRSDTAADMISSGKRAPGTHIEGPGSAWLTPGSLKLCDAGSLKQVMFGDESGPTADSGSITLKFKMTTLPSNTSHSIRARVMCPQEDAAGQDADTTGYVFQCRRTGQIHLWAANLVAGQPSTVLGTVPIGTPLTTSTEVILKFEWTATHVRLSRLDGTPVDTGWVADTTFGRTAKPGDQFHYVVPTMTTGTGIVTEFVLAA